MKEFDSIARDFIDTYKGEQLAICAVGAGALLNSMTLFLGAASVINTVHSPYGEDAVENFLVDNKIEAPSGPCVSEQMARALYGALEEEAPGMVCIAITGAVTSQRYRRGKDHAYIMANDQIVYVELKKLEEKEHKTISVMPGLHQAYRDAQDFAISKIALDMVMGRPILYEAGGIIENVTAIRSLCTSTQ